LNFMILKSTTAATSDTRSKRVCMIAYTSYPFDGRVRLEAESLVKWGYEVIIQVPKEHAEPKTYSLAGVTVQELNVRKIRDQKKLRYIFSYIEFLLLAFVSCTHLFIRSRIKIIHIHNMPDVLVFAALIPRLFGCKVILDLHDTVPETYEAKFGEISGLLSSLLCLEERVCCFIANRVICVNHVQRDAVIKRGIPSAKIATVITMPRHISPGTQPSLEPRIGFRMVNHGTISKRLGNDLILEAAAKLVRHIPDFELHIIGDGDNLNHLRSRSHSLGIDDYVHFHPGVPCHRLAEMLQIMDVGIVANRVNAATALMLPSKLIDYAVLGIPAIVPRLRGIQYYFSPDMVSYFEPENTDSMVAATLKLYHNPALRKGQAKNARRFVDDNQWDRIGTGLRSLYEDLLTPSLQQVEDTTKLEISQRGTPVEMELQTKEANALSEEVGYPFQIRTSSVQPSDKTT
jgi:glycosyltransferase involved in cell wall biosynthesis